MFSIFLSEYNTAAKVVEHLQSYGIEEIFEGVGKTGVVALIRGGEPGPCVGLRYYFFWGVRHMP